MPTIGWFEILIIITVAIVILGPKDFPVMLKKIGTWVGSFKSYFTEFQKDLNDIEKTVEDEISLDKEIEDINNKKKDE